MRTINRTAAVITPKEPYKHWATALGYATNEDFEADDQETQVYLLPDTLDHKDAMKKLRKVYMAVFDEELEGWSEDRELWPTKRTFAMFQEWFGVRFASLVIDLADEPLASEGM